MKVLVTGATGFLGQYVVEQLQARGDDVRGLCRRAAPELQRLGVEVVRGDITDRAAVVAACRDVDAVIHTAAVASIWGPWDCFYSTNVLGTRHVLEGCREHGVGRLIYTSSPSVTFDGAPQRNVDETAPYPNVWLAHYPLTKAMAEQEVLIAHQAGRLHTCSLRPHLIWGPRDRHLIPRLLDRARSGRLRRIGDGSNRVDMIYVENAAAAHLAAVDKLAAAEPIGGRAFFLSQGEPVNCWRWIDEILALAGLPPVRKSVSAASARRVGAVCEFAWRVLRRNDEPPMTRFLAAQLATDHYFNIDRARRELGYVPRVSTAEGMRRLGAWLRSGQMPGGG
jgi:nucleoside-diphosphate-sugar epimerase